MKYYVRYVLGFEVEASHWGEALDLADEMRVNGEYTCCESREVEDEDGDCCFSGNGDGKLFENGPISEYKRKR